MYIIIYNKLRKELWCIFMKSKRLGNPVTSDCFLNTQKKALNNKSLNQNIEYTTDRINNPVYSYQVKSNKKMSEPIQDDSIIGGYFNLGMMTTAEADRYTKAKQKANAERALKEKEQRAKAYNPFAGFDDMINSSDDNDFSL